jgi:WD40 repeat protein
MIKMWSNALFPPTSIDVSKDGKHVVTLNGWTATIFSMTPQGLRRERELRGNLGKAYNIAFSPDGSRIISSSPTAAVRPWDTNSGRELLNIPNKLLTFGATFSPDGTKIAAPSGTGVYIWYGTGN